MKNIYIFCFFSIILFTLFSAQVMAQAVSVTVAMQSCPGNAGAKVTATGGAGTPYTYGIQIGTGVITWQASSSFTGLTVGTTYKFYARDVNNLQNAVAPQLKITAYSNMSISKGTVGNTLVTACNPDGSIDNLVVTGGTAPFAYLLKIANTSTVVRRIDTTASKISFQQLPTGNYDIEIIDYCGASSIVKAYSVVSRYNVSGITFGSVDGVQLGSLSSTGCDISGSFAADNMLLKATNGDTIFYRYNGKLTTPSGYPLEARIEYPSGSGIYTPWKVHRGGVFNIPNYDPGVEQYRVQVRNPCDTNNIVTSPIYTMAYPYSYRSGFCSRAIVNNIAGYYCGPVHIRLVKSGVTVKEFDWDGIGSSYELDLSDVPQTNGYYFFITPGTGKTEYQTPAATSASINLGNYILFYTNFFKLLNCSFFYIFAKLPTKFNAYVISK